jgi:hypothetical protein
MNLFSNRLLRFTNRLLIIVFSGKTRKGNAKLHHFIFFIILNCYVSTAIKSIFIAVLRGLTLNAES